MGRMPNRPAVLDLASPASRRHHAIQPCLITVQHGIWPGPDQFHHRLSLLRFLRQDANPAAGQILD